MGAPPPCAVTFAPACVVGVEGVAGVVGVVADVAGVGEWSEDAVGETAAGGRVARGSVVEVGGRAAEAMVGEGPGVALS